MIKKIIGGIFAFLIIGFTLTTLTGCATSKSIVSRGVDLSKYKYAAAINDDAYRMPPELVQYQIQLYDAVEQSGLKMVNQYRIHEMTQEERSALLFVTFGVTSGQAQETIITVNFMDYDSGRPLVSCQGVYSTLMVNPDAEIKGALKRVGEQIHNTFK